MLEYRQTEILGRPEDVLFWAVRENVGARGAELKTLVSEAKERKNYKDWGVLCLYRNG